MRDKIATIIYEGQNDVGWSQALKLADAILALEVEGKKGKRYCEHFDKKAVTCIHPEYPKTLPCTGEWKFPKSKLCSKLRPATIADLIGGER